MYKSHNIMSLLRDMKLMSRDRIFLSRDKSVDLIGVYHVARHYLNICDKIFSAFDKFSQQVTSLAYLLLLRSIAGPGDLLSKHALGIL